MSRPLQVFLDDHDLARLEAWSRAKGLFAGISLNGATLHTDADDNEQLYGRKLTNREVIMGNVAPPAAAKPLIAALDRYAGRESNADRSK